LLLLLLLSGHFSHLKVLNAKGNQLTNLPATFATLAKLTKLDLSDNLFETVPDSIS